MRLATCLGRRSGFVRLDGAQAQGRRDGPCYVAHPEDRWWRRTALSTRT